MSNINTNPYSEKIDVNSFVGKQYDKITILQFEYFKQYKKSRQPFFKCVCDCNNEFVIGLWALKTKSKILKSCGCSFAEAKRLPGDEACFNRVYQMYYSAATKREYKFKLDKIIVRKLTSDNCHYCGIEPFLEMKSDNNVDSYKYNGIDRIDNTKGYLEDNVVTCCITCNKAKSTLTYEEFIDWVKRIYAHSCI